MENTVNKDSVADDHKVVALREAEKILLHEIYTNFASKIMSSNLIPNTQKINAMHFLNTSYLWIKEGYSFSEQAQQIQIEDVSSGVFDDAVNAD